MSHLIDYKYRSVGGRVINASRRLRDSQRFAEGEEALLDEFTGSITPLVEIHGTPVTPEQKKRMAGAPVMSSFDWPERGEMKRDAGQV